MQVVFYGSAAVALLSTVMVITRHNAVHAALYLVVSLLSVALIFFTLGAPFAGALEIIVYAGAIMVLIVFVLMLLNLGRAAGSQERTWLPPSAWIGPGVLTMALAVQLVFLMTRDSMGPVGQETIQASQVAHGLFGGYLIGVELASMLLMAGLVGAYHLGTNVHRRRGRERRDA